MLRIKIRRRIMTTVITIREVSTVEATCCSTASTIKITDLDQGPIKVLSLEIKALQFIQELISLILLFLILTMDLFHQTKEHKQLICMGVAARIRATISSILLIWRVARTWPMIERLWGRILMLIQQRGPSLRINKMEKTKKKSQTICWCLRIGSSFQSSQLMKDRGCLDWSLQRKIKR